MALPNIADIREAARALRVMGAYGPHRGEYARIATAFYANDPYAREAYLFAGGRFNYALDHAEALGLPDPKRGCALYLAERPLTAAREVLEPYGVVPSRLVFRVRVDLRRVLDLRQDSALRALGITRADLEGDWQTAAKQARRSPSQDIGLALATAAIQGILTYSVRDPDQTNLTVFTSTLLRSFDRLEVVDVSPDPTNPGGEGMWLPRPPQRFP